MILGPSGIIKKTLGAAENEIKLTDVNFCKENFYGKINVLGVENFYYMDAWISAIYIEYRGEKYIIKNRHSYIFPSSIKVVKVDKFELQCTSLDVSEIHSMTCKVFANSRLYMSNYEENERFVQITYGTKTIPNALFVIYNKQDNCIDVLRLDGDKIPMDKFNLLLQSENKKGEIENGI